MKTVNTLGLYDVINVLESLGTSGSELESYPR